MNNKPQSMPLREWLVALTANKLGMNEELCDTIISWAYEKAQKATLNNATIELSGFGKIYANGKKLDRKLVVAKDRLSTLYKESTSYMSEEGLKKHNDKIEQTQQYLKYLESKTNENRENKGIPESIAEGV